jgi:hypothetical protein
MPTYEIELYKGLDEDCEWYYLLFVKIPLSEAKEEEKWHKSGKNAILEVKNLTKKEYETISKKEKYFKRETVEEVLREILRDQDDLGEGSSKNIK